MKTQIFIIKSKNGISNLELLGMLEEGNSSVIWEVKEVQGKEVH